MLNLYGKVYCAAADRTEVFGWVSRPYRTNAGTPCIRVEAVYRTWGIVGYEYRAYRSLGYSYGKHTKLTKVLGTNIEKHRTYRSVWYRYRGRTKRIKLSGIGSYRDSTPGVLRYAPY